MCIELTLLPDVHVEGRAEKNKICRKAYMLKGALRPVAARQ